VAQVFDFMVARQLEVGSLVQVLPSFASDGPLLHAILPARRASIPRVRVFLNGLEELLGVGPRTGVRRRNRLEDGRGSVPPIL
jgi:DNA-binding transcriptional LysR family regulator